MNALLITGSIIVTAALASYSIAVITEQLKKVINRTTLIFITLGITLDITATAADPFILDVTSLNLANDPGEAANFNPNASYNWTFLTAAGGIFGFLPEVFLINTDDFQNDFLAGAFSVSQMGDNSLSLNYQGVIPEPSALVIWGVLGALAVVAARRRRKVA